MIGGRNFTDQRLKGDTKADGNIRKIANGQGDYYTSCSLPDYPYLKES